MNRSITLAVMLVVMVAGATPASTQGQLDEQQRRALRTSIDEHFDVVPLTDGIALRPKTRLRDVRLIEISDGTIAINGAPVTGRELRERIGSDATADAIMRLSYLDAEARRSLFSPAVEAPRPPAEPAVEFPSPTATDPSRPRRERSRGDRVRIFGDVAVSETELVDGQVVAVLGSVRIDGEVDNQVVAVLGSVDLGPNAVVRQDVISVGGRVRRAPGAQVRGGVTEVSIGENVHFHGDWFDWAIKMPFFHDFGAVPRLIGSGFRLLLLMLLASIALVLARPSVEASAQRLVDDPLKATIVGVAAEILLGPVLILAAIVLAISIVGIPVLILLTPVVVLVLILMALIGFSGAAYALGQWARRRLGMASAGGFTDLLLGVFIVLLPLLVGRLIAIGGWPVTGVSLMLIAGGLALELLAWTSGFGAVLMNTFSRWRARRASRIMTQPPPVIP
jgi:hypothetical protein